MMGKPMSTVVGMAVHEMIMRDSAAMREYLKLKQEILQKDDQSSTRDDRN
jgi:hypothetical protein